MRDTSRAAYDSITPHLNRLQQTVLGFIEGRPSTSDEIEVTLGLRHQTCAARITELAKLGLISDSRFRRPTRSGRNAIVWRAT